MYQLTLEQKISNLEDLILLKNMKIQRLEEEVNNLEIKKAKLSKKLEINSSSSSTENQNSSAEKRLGW